MKRKKGRTILYLLTFCMVLAGCGGPVTGSDVQIDTSTPTGTTTTDSSSVTTTDSSGTTTKGSPGTTTKGSSGTTTTDSVGSTPTQAPPSTGGNIVYTPLSQTYSHVTGGNPLKGFIPYKGSYNTIPYSMEWFYIPLSDLMSGPDTYTFDTGLEPVLNEIASRGNQAVFRVYLDYPNEKKDAVPQFIWDMGVKKISYSRDGSSGVMPDYTDQRLIDVLVKFVEEMGRRYDGDPRIGFITCGLIGHWGEWHVYLNNEQGMPSDAQQNQIFRAYDKSFPITKVLARYPTSADVSSMNIGFHDDSFTESTIPSPSASYSWYFMNMIKKAGADNKWKTEAVGGEFRPEGQVPFLNGAKPSGYQDYTECVRQTHCSWLIMHDSFNRVLTAAQKQRAEEGSAQLGYELYVASSAVTVGSNATVSVKLENRGVAPFYYNWKIRLGVVQNGKIVTTFDTDWALTDCLPDSPVNYQTSISLDKLPTGISTLVLMVENPLKTGKQFQFANASQDKDLKGWVSLGSLSR